MTELAAFEIQVRDIFEEGWGEVQHHLLYSDKDADDSDEVVGDQADLAAPWRLHLNALKTFVDGCSQHASIIRMHYDSVDRGPTPANTTQSVTERDKDRINVIQTLKRLDAPEAAIEDVAAAYALLESGEQAAVVEDKLTRFAEASTRFSKAMAPLTRKMRRETVPSAHERTLEYFIKMEQGNAKFAAVEVAGNLPQSSACPLEAGTLTSARALYIDVSRKFPNDPVVFTRLGKTWEALTDDETALGKALDMFSKAVSLVHNDPLTGTDHWLAILVHVNKSYVLWLQSRLDSNIDREFELLKLAADASLQAVQVWKSQSDIARVSDLNRLQAHKAASNVLYFVGRLCTAGQASETDYKQVLRDHIKIMDEIAIDGHSDYYKTRDNLIFAYTALQDTEQARGLATLNFRELRDLAEQRAGRPLDMESIGSHLRASEARCFETARDVLLMDSVDGGESVT